MNFLTLSYALLGEEAWLNFVGEFAGSSWAQAFQSLFARGGLTCREPEFFSQRKALPGTADFHQQEAAFLFLRTAVVHWCLELGGHLLSLFSYSTGQISHSPTRIPKGRDIYPF